MNINFSSVTIHGWMITQHKLEGKTLLLYALIYQSSQLNSGYFSVNEGYLKQWLGLTPVGIKKHLQTLVTRGLIKSEVIGGNLWQVNYNKALHKDQVEVKPKREPKTSPDFARFWDMYGKKVGKEKAINAFNRLPKKAVNDIFKHVPEYVKATDKQFRANPATYLNGKMWLDEIIVSSPKEKVAPQEKSINYGDL